MPKTRLSAALALVLVATAAVQTVAAQAQAAAETTAQPDLADLLWVARPLVVFADSPRIRDTSSRWSCSRKARRCSRTSACRC